MRKRKFKKYLKPFQNSISALFILMEILFLAYCLNRGTAQTYLFCLPGLIIWSLGILYLTNFSRFGLLIILLQHIGLVSLIGINIYSFEIVYKILVATIAIGVCFQLVKVELDHRFLLMVILGCYVLLKIFGVDPYNTGTTNTIDIGIINFQITELTKLLTILCLGKIINLKIPDFKKLLWILTTVCVNALPLMYFRELGTLLMILVIAMICIFLSLPKRYTLIIVMVGLVGAGCAALYWSIVKNNYPLSNGVLNQIYELINKIYTRIFASSSSHEDVSQQAGQAYRYIVLGGLFGQKDELQLYANSTDFAFSNLIYNCGLIIGILYAVGMSLLYIEGNHAISEKNPEFIYRKEKSNSIVGILLLIEIMIRTFYLMMMNLTVFPICGIPLPFLSYGLSSTLTLYYSLFLLGGKENEKKTLFKNSYIQLSCASFIFNRMRGNILKHRYNKGHQRRCRFFQKTAKLPCRKSKAMRSLICR